MNRFFWARVAYHRWRRRLQWILHPLPWATVREDANAYPLTVAERTSPLKRAPTGAIAAYAEEKAQNLQLAAGCIDGCVILPGAVFSFCRTVGGTTRRRGFMPALEMHDGNMQPEIGGGLCQLANLLLLLAIDVNAEIVERHRHSYDLFRDVERNVPFGCGATVFFNYVDFQFRNLLSFPLRLHVTVTPSLLTASLQAAQPLPFAVRLLETDHHFYRHRGDVYRTNRVWKEITIGDGPPRRVLLFTNNCHVRYPADDLVEFELPVGLSPAMLTASWTDDD